MSRPLRIEFDGAWYHVMNRGIARKNIFNNNNQRYFFLNLLEEASRKFKIEFHAYCLMSNHYHLLIHTPKSGLAKAMRHINGIYTQCFNKFEKRDGPLFKGRYKAILIDDDEYLLNVSRYIHLNPVEARMVDVPEEYHWSSYRIYIQKCLPSRWLNTDMILSLIVENQASDDYQHYVNLGVDEETKEFYSQKKMPVIFGGEEFKKEHLNSLSQQKKERSKPDFNHTRIDPKIEDIVSFCSHYFKIDKEALTRYRPGKKNRFRDIAIYLCTILTQDKLSDIADYFNCKTKSGVGSAACKIKKLAKTDLQLKEILEKGSGILATEVCRITANLGRENT